MGCDHGFYQLLSGNNDFNPRSPSGLRHITQKAIGNNQRLFQSTQPEWAATLSNKRKIEAKYVVCYTKETQDVYELTEAGKNTLDLTLDILPGIIKLKVDTNLKSNIEMFENAQSIVSEYTPKSENEYEVVCKIIEDNEVIFEIKTFAYSREQAQNIVENWKKNATNLYPQLIGLLTKK